MEATRNGYGIWVAAAALAWCWGFPAFAQDAEELQKIAANPIASTISTEVQFNFLNDVGSSGDVLNTAVFQPVIPQKLTDSWNLIHRPLLPLIYDPVLGGQGNVCLPSGCLPESVSDDSVFGLGDTTYQMFFSPAESKPIWGTGPTIRAPSHTDERLGKDAWSLGFDAVALWQLKKTMVGALVVQLWSVTADTEDDEVNETLFQPFVNHRLGGGWALISSPLISANWKAPSGNQWTVPLGGGFSKLTGKKTPIVYKVQVHYNVVRPDGGAQWVIQFGIQPMFPKK